MLTCCRFVWTIRRLSTSVAKSRSDLPALALMRLNLCTFLSRIPSDPGDGELLRDVLRDEVGDDTCVRK